MLADQCDILDELKTKLRDLKQKDWLEFFTIFGDWLCDDDYQTRLSEILELNQKFDIDR
jgi:hypothetical protein